MIGLVLAGGAARGAYEAGVMRFLYDELPERTGQALWPDIVSGTSVGALNGVFVASRKRQGVCRVSQIWREMEIESIYRLRLGDMRRALSAVFQTDQAFGLLDPSPLYGLVFREFPRLALRRAIGSGDLKAFIVAATELDTGFNTLFVDSAQALGIHATANTRVVREPVTPRHCLASAALPFVFPAVKVGGSYHVDGGLRQNTPLRPVLHAGARRVLIVGLKAAPADEFTPTDLTPNLSFLLGKSLNALLLDPVERDLQTTRRYNEIIQWGIDRFGPAFGAAIEAELGLRTVKTLFLRPSEDIGHMAAETWARHGAPGATGTVKYMLSAMHDQANVQEADLLSYLYFDRVFTAQLEQLGFEDARAQEDAIVDLLTGPLQ